MPQFSIGLVGAGAIGRMHADVILKTDFCRVTGVADPTAAGRRFCDERGFAWFSNHSLLLEQARPDALIVATPNNTHLSISLDAIAAGVPVLVEKPIAGTVEEGEALAAASDRAGVPVLVGHHRRHNPIIARARELVASGELGRLTNVSVLYAFFKPAPYFDVAWRREPGGGPILINLIHEIDLVRFVCGEIEAVQAVTSNAVRGLPVEDTAAVLLQLTNGALVTIGLSDTAVTPWSWDLASGELPSYPPQPAPVNSHFICGTRGSLTLPGLDLWRYEGDRSWFAELSRDTLAVTRESPYVEQLRHLCEVARGRTKPLIDAADATKTLQATLAVNEAARTQRRVTLTSG